MAEKYQTTSKTVWDVRRERLEAGKPLVRVRSIYGPYDYPLEPDEAVAAYLEQFLPGAETGEHPRLEISVDILAPAERRDAYTVVAFDTIDKES